MKTKLISTLKKELLIVEAKDEKIAWAIIFQKHGVKAVSDYTLLGKPDEIKEEDVVDLCDRIGINNPLADCYFFAHYGNDETMFEYATESFNSALESEIYWVNPLGNEPILHEYAKGRFCIHEPKEWERTLSEQKTFDRNRTLIFVKN